jgi:hypothetical protein
MEMTLSLGGADEGRTWPQALLPNPLREGLNVEVIAFGVLAFLFTCGLCCGSAM